jgi:hypothetical protein
MLRGSKYFSVFGGRTPMLRIFGEEGRAICPWGDRRRVLCEDSSQAVWVEGAISILTLRLT